MMREPIDKEEIRQYQRDGGYITIFIWIERRKKRIVEATLNVFQPNDVTQFNL